MTKANTFKFTKGIWGPPPEAEGIFLKIKQNEGFFFKVRFFLNLFFFYFLKGFLNPQNYELALKIHENNNKIK